MYFLLHVHAVEHLLIFCFFFVLRSASWPVFFTYESMVSYIDWGVLPPALFSGTRTRELQNSRVDYIPVVSGPTPLTTQIRNPTGPIYTDILTKILQGCTYIYAEEIILRADCRKSAHTLYIIMRQLFIIEIGEIYSIAFSQPTCTVISRGR